MNISVIILAYNESIHIRRCIENVLPVAREVFVVDCFSTDKTEEEVRKSESSKVLKLDADRRFDFESGGRGKETGDGCAVWFVQREWPGTQAIQFNWALEHLPIRAEWVLRLDADEYLCPELIEEIKVKLETLPEDVTGVAFHLRRVFMGRVIRRGMPRIKMVRLFRYGKARCEQRLMDEHIELLEGRAVAFEGEFADHNLNDIGWWTAKHNGYALREAVDLLDLEYGLFGIRGNVTTEGTEAEVAVGSQQYGRRGTGLEGQAAEKRRKKMRYARLPLFWRTFAYFCYRYFVKGGFLEGKEGFLWHFLQGWWYRTLVDAKVWEIKRESGGDKDKMLALLRGKYGMKV